MSLAVQRQPQTDAPAFRVRQARRGEVEAIAALFAELGYAGAPDVSTVHWVLSHPEMEVVVACDAVDKPVGVVTLSHRPQLRMKGRIATIDELVVARAWRRRGVGRALLKRVVDRARSLTARRIEIATHPGWDEGTLAFLSACGFGVAEVRVARFSEIDFDRR